jgi:mediator of RNA polymerase II transcription subunit 12, fungi type
LTIAALEHVASNDGLNTVVETLRRFEDIWVAKNVVHRIVASLYATHGRWRHRGIQNRLLLSALIEMDQHGYLDASAREQVRIDKTALFHVRSVIFDVNPY